MGKEDNAFGKMALLMKAMMEANARDEAMKNLEAAAFEMLMLHPGSTFTSWSFRLATQCETELTDAFGNDIASGIVRLWDTSYRDRASGLTHTFQEWADIFSTEQAAEVYFKLINKNDVNTLT